VNNKPVTSRKPPKQHQNEKQFAAAYKEQN